jgi:hypothetical protein
MHVVDLPGFRVIILDVHNEMHVVDLPGFRVIILDVQANSLLFSYLKILAFSHDSLAYCIIPGEH